MRRWTMLWWRLGKDDLRLLWFAIHHPLRPGWLIPATGLLALLAIEPLNFAFPVFGAVDDLVLLPLALHTLLRFLPSQIRTALDSRK